MMMGAMDAKKKVLEELMQHLDMKDGETLGDSMKPKGVGVETMKVEKLGGDGEPDGDDSSPEDLGDDSKPKMSDEEMEELIQALQSKLG